MVFILGINIIETKMVKSALESFYGIGSSVSSRLMARLSIHRMAKIGSLTQKTVLQLQAELGGLKIEEDLRRDLQANIQRLRDIGTYRGRRHALGLPVRGQGTRTQAKTAKKLNRLVRREGRRGPS